MPLLGYDKPTTKSILMGTLKTSWYLGHEACILDQKLDIEERDLEQHFVEKWRRRQIVRPIIPCFGMSGKTLLCVRRLALRTSL
jgi:hypothetical protein